MMENETVESSDGVEDKDQETEDDISSKLAFHADPDKLDDDGKPRNKISRKMSRNESEKLRRDRLNAYIGELAKLVPLILTANRKMDKSSVLRLTVNYLRMYHDLAKNPEFRRQWRPEFLNSENLGSMLLESTGGFLMVISRRGTLTFCTDAITQQLGHNLVDVLGNPIYSIIHPDDHSILQKQFYYPNNGQTHNMYPIELENLMPRSTSRSFYVRMLDNTCKQNNKYQSVHIVAHLKSVPPVNSSNPQTGLAAHLNEPDVCLIGVGRIDYAETPKELFPIDSSSDQWMTRHELDGKLTFSDPRCAYISGFMPEETLGMSPYALLHKDDIGIVVAAHKIFMSTGLTPMTCFRMYTKSQDIIYVRTHTHMVVDMWTSRPRYIVSINEVLGEEEGKEAMIKVKEQPDMKEQLMLMTESTAKMSIEGATESPPGVEDDDDNKNDDVKDPCSPKSPLVPDVVMETGDRLDIYVDKTKKYTVDLTLTEIYDPHKVGQSVKSVENIVYDPYPPVNATASQTPNSPAEITMSPKPVFLGSSPRPSEIDSVSVRSVRSSRHSSISSNPRSNASPGQHIADSASSPINASDVTSSNPGPVSSSATHMDLLQQLNRRMAAAPPQLQPVATNGHSTRHIAGFAKNSNGHVSKRGQDNPMLVHLLQRRPLPDLDGSCLQKIMNEIPGFSQWQDMTRAQHTVVGFDGGGSEGVTTQSSCLTSNGLVGYENVASSPSSQFERISSGNDTIGSNYYDSAQSQHLSDFFKRQSSFHSNHSPLPTNQSPMRISQLPLGSHRSPTYNACLNENTSPQSHCSNAQSPPLSNNQSPLGYSFSKQECSPQNQGVYNETPSHPGSVSSTGNCGSLSYGLDGSPPTIQGSNISASSMTPQKNQQIQNQLELLKEIEARREAHERALLALKQEYALQVKQLVNETSTTPSIPTTSSIADAVGIATTDASIASIATNIDSMTTDFISESQMLTSSAANSASFSQDLYTGQGSVHRPVSQQSAGPLSTMSQQSLTLSSQASAAPFNQGNMSLHSLLDNSQTLTNSSSSQVQNPIADAQLVNSQTGDSSVLMNVSCSQNAISGDASNKNEGGLDLKDSALDSLLDSSLLMSGLGAGDLSGDNEVDLSSILNTLLTSDSPSSCTSASHGNNASGYSHSLPQNNQFSGEQNNPTTQTGYSHSPNEVLMENADMSGGQDNNVILNKLKQVNLTPALYLKLLSQLHSTENKNNDTLYSAQDRTKVSSNGSVCAAFSSQASSSNSFSSFTNVDSNLKPKFTNSGHISNDVQQALGVHTVSTNSSVDENSLQPSLSINALLNNPSSTTSSNSLLPISQGDRDSFLSMSGGSGSSNQDHHFEAPAKSSDISQSSQSEMASRLQQQQRKEFPHGTSEHRSNTSDGEQIVGILQHLIESGDKTVLDALLKGGICSLPKKSSQSDLTLMNGT